MPESMLLSIERQIRGGFFKCEICKKECSNRKQGKNRYCSRRCVCVAHCRKQLQKVDVSCPVCGALHKKKPSESGRKYCSRACYEISRQRVKKICGVCLKEFLSDPSRLKKQSNIYCSKHCANIAAITLGDQFCVVCGKLILINKRGKRVRATTRRIYCSKKCFGISEKGHEHHNWQGGKKLWDDISERGAGWHEQKRKVRKRDNYTCQDCGKTETELGYIFHAHHIVPYFNFTSRRKSNRLSNLICLCRVCHAKAEWRIKDRQMVFIGRMS